MQLQSLEFKFKARYYKLGELNAATRQVWFVLHGYGQLAQYFIRKFDVLQEHHICVIAPEGLSKFYLENLPNRLQSSDTRVGATWMTKENRTVDIENYITYLNTLYHQELPGTQHAPVTVFGFSQGAATASRWAAHGDIEFQRLILWAGVFPPDIDFSAGRNNLQGKDIAVVYGSADPFVNDDRFAEMEKISESLHVQPKVVTFDGGHDIDRSTLLQFVQR